MTIPSIEALPDLLTFFSGRKVCCAADWGARRAELLDVVMHIGYGKLPPAPEAVSAYPLHRFRLPGSELMGEQYRLTAQPTGFSFLATLYRPAGDGPFPTIIDGDGCWRYLTDEIIHAVLGRGYALAMFNRVEIAADNGTPARDAGLYPAYPDGDYGALSAWAWGYHRVVDFLLGLPEVDAARLIATGHSRGGKAALLAGATDERLALTAPNNSGCGGAGCFRFPDEGGERLANCIEAFPYWYAPRLQDFVGREHELPFDLHGLKALVAPRALLTTEARGDIWASPRGTRLTHDAARNIWGLFGVEERIGIRYRDGGHFHGPDDWQALLDFADWQFYGQARARDFDMHP